MSLATDIVFVKALMDDRSLTEQLAAKAVYNTAIALPEPEALNAPVPYIIVSFDGLNNTDTTKDTMYDGLTDIVTIGIEIAAKSREELANIALSVRNDIKGYITKYANHEIYSYEFSASPVRYDDQKPCYYQKFTYQCVTDPDK